MLPILSPNTLVTLAFFLIAVADLPAQQSVRQDDSKDSLQVVELPADLSVTRDVEYARVGEPEVVLRYDMIRAEGARGDGDRSGQNRSPFLLFIHGGGWKGGDRNSYYRRLFFEATESLIRQGLVVATIDYRLAKKDGPTTLDSVADCRAALNYFQSNADALGLDVARIAVMGGSAGGHLSLMTALAGDRAGGTPPNVKACIPFYPLCHFGGVELHPQIMEGASYGSVGKFSDMLGGPAEEHRELAEYLSPITHLRGDMPTVLLLHGDADPVLPVASARAFAEKARQVQAPVTYLEVAGGNHGFRTANEPDVDEIIRRVRQFVATELGL